MKKYKHFKGEVYTLLCIANHSETDEKLVIYEDEDGNTYARPYEMFFDEVNHNNQTIQRFTELK